MKQLGWLFFWFLLTTSAFFIASTAEIFSQDASSSFSELPKVTGTRRALIIAVSTYFDSMYGDLPQVDEDVDLMKETFLKTDFSEKDIWILKASSNKLPTRKNILKTIEDFAKACEPDDLAFVALIGRGARDSQTNKDYYIPLDADSLDFRTFVPLDQVMELLNACRAKEKLLVVDASKTYSNKGSLDNIFDFESVGETYSNKGSLDNIFDFESVKGETYSNEGSLDTNSELESVKGERRALLIAVPEYGYNLTDLPSVNNDVNLMREQLLESGFKINNIQVLSGAHALREIILETVEEFSKKCNSEDLAFIMLTGHGLRDDKTNKDFFLPLDAKVTDKITDFNTFVPIDFVIDSLESSKANFKWLLVDACRNSGKSGVLGNSVGILEPKPGMLIFQSCSPYETSYFTDDGQYGLFVHTFIEGLQGAAIDENGRVSVIGAFDYAYEKIHDIQSPVKKTSSDFVDFALYENREWIRAAEYYHTAMEALEANDYIKAQSDISLACIFHKDYDKYIEKKAIIDQAVEIVKKSEENNISSNDIDSNGQK